jgi:hypothetical protein
MTEVIVKRLSLDHVTAGTFCALVVGGRHSGKSTLVKHFIQECQLPEFKRVIVFSPVEDYSNLVPSDCFFRSASADSLEKVLNKHIQTAQNALLIVFDDCDMKTLLRNEVTKRNILNGRLIGVSFVVTVQYALDFPIAFRAACDYSFFRDSRLSTTRIREQFFPFLNTAVFNTVFSQCSQDFEFLVRDHSSTELYYYKPYPFTSAAEKCRRRLCVFIEDLMKACWHPKRVLAWEESGCEM